MAMGMAISAQKSGAEETPRCTAGVACLSTAILFGVDQVGLIELGGGQSEIHRVTSAAKSCALPKRL